MDARLLLTALQYCVTIFVDNFRFSSVWQFSQHFLFSVLWASTYVLSDFFYALYIIKSLFNAGGCFYSFSEFEFHSRCIASEEKLSFASVYKKEGR